MRYHRKPAAMLDDAPPAASRPRPFDAADFLADVASSVPQLERERAKPLPTAWSVSVNLLVFNLAGAFLWWLHPGVAVAVLVAATVAAERWLFALEQNARRVLPSCMTALSIETRPLAVAVWKMRSRRLFRWYLRSGQLGTGTVVCSVLMQASAFTLQDATYILAQLAALACLGLALVRGHQCLHLRPVQEAVHCLASQSRPW